MVGKEKSELRQMKKTLCLILSALLILYLAACAGSAMVSETAAPTAAPSPSIDPRDEEIANLKAQVAGLESDIAQLRKALARREEMIEEVGLDNGTMLQWTVTEPECRLWLTTTDTTEYFSYKSEPLYGGAACFQTGTLLEAFVELSYTDYENSESGESVTMLLVAYPVYSIPTFPLVWVKLENCTPYTSANRYDITNPVTARSGAKLYEYWDESDEPWGTYDDGHDSPNIINRIDNGWAYIIAPGGWEARVAVGDIVYPDPAKFTYCR